MHPTHRSFMTRDILTRDVLLGPFNGSFMSPCLVHIFLKCDFRCTRVLKVLQNGRWVFQWELKENLLFVTFFSDGYGPVADRQNHIDQQTLVNHGNPVRTQTRPSGSTHVSVSTLSLCLCPNRVSVMSLSLAAKKRTINSRGKHG